MIRKVFVLPGQTVPVLQRLEKSLKTIYINAKGSYFCQYIFKNLSDYFPDRVCTVMKEYETKGPLILSVSHRNIASNSAQQLKDAIQKEWDSSNIIKPFLNDWL